MPTAHSNRDGFTLIEAMIAIALGIIMVNLAVAMLWFYNKTFAKMEYTNVKTQTVQGAMLSLMARAPYYSTTGSTLNTQFYPFNGTKTTAECGRNLGISQITVSNSIYTITIKDYKTNTLMNIPFPGDQ